MAKPRLKVYRAQMGFAEAIVAAPSQKAALQAWGARQNLFAEGLATVAEDAEEVGAATAKPGVVLQRPGGIEERLQRGARRTARAAAGEARGGWLQDATEGRQAAARTGPFRAYGGGEGARLA